MRTTRGAAIFVLVAGTRSRNCSDLLFIYLFIGCVNEPLRWIINEPLIRPHWNRVWFFFFLPRMVFNAAAISRPGGSPNDRPTERNRTTPASTSTSLRFHTTQPSPSSIIVVVVVVVVVATASAAAAVVFVLLWRVLRPVRPEMISTLIKKRTTRFVYPHLTISGRGIIRK